MPIACQSGEGLTGVCHVFTLQKYYFFVGERYEYRKTCVASDILSLFLREDVILRSADGHRVKRAFAARLSNWQLFEGGREAATLRRPRRGDVCAVLRLCHAWVRTYPGAERENMWHVDRKSPRHWKKRDFATKMREFLHKAPRFLNLLARRKAARELFRRQVGRSIFSEGTRCERRRGKREAFHSKKSPLQGRGCAAKGIYSKCAARWATVIRLDVAGGRDR